MHYLNETELKLINGGINYGIIAVIGGIIVFIIRLIDGYTRPLKCR